jgi:hypothetical protein
MSHGERQAFKNPVINWIDERLPIFTMMEKEYGSFPTPRNFNYLWNFGALSMFMLITMIATGVFLAMEYTPSTDHAFTSVERIMRDVNWGWFLRYMHANGASFFFIVVYVHIFRGMYYGSYKKPRELRGLTDSGCGWGYSVARISAPMGPAGPFANRSDAVIAARLFSSCIRHWAYGPEPFRSP